MGFSPQGENRESANRHINRQETPRQARQVWEEPERCVGAVGGSAPEWDKKPDLENTMEGAVPRDTAAGTEVAPAAAREKTTA